MNLKMKLDCDICKKTCQTVAETRRYASDPNIYEVCDECEKRETQMNLFFWCMDSVAYNFSCKRIYCTTPEGFVRSYPAIRDSAAKIRKLRK